MKKRLQYFLLFLLTLALAPQCTTDNTGPQPPEQSPQWFCSTLADLQTDPTDSLDQHLKAVGYKNKWWANGYTFKVGYLGTKTAAQTAMVQSVCAEWAAVANVKFEFPAAGPYDIRISFNPNGGAWSYVGIDAKNIAQTSPTMNLGWLARDAYLHEFGHALGLLHEHQNPTGAIKWNKPVVYAALSGPPNNWTVAMIDFNVLNPYPLPNVITTALDKVSIMHYPIPATWTLDGYSSPGGLVISAVDKTFIGGIYPFVTPPPTGSVVLTNEQVNKIVVEVDAAMVAFDSAAVKLRRSQQNLKKALGRQ